MAPIAGTSGSRWCFNSSLIFRSMLGAGKPREWKDRHTLVSFLFFALFHGMPRLKNRKTLSFEFDDRCHIKIVAISVISFVI
jgi:hypothetical protein